MNVRLLVTVLFLYTLVCSGITEAAEKLPLVLFDQGHGQRFLIEEKGELQLSGLSERITAQNTRVVSYAGELTQQGLIDVSAVVISGAFGAYKPEEVESLGRFVEKGGRLAVMLHIGPPLAELLHRFDVDISNIVLHERQNTLEKDTNFQVRALTELPLFSDVPYFSLYGGWALNPGTKGSSLARTSSEAWVDLNGDRKFSEGDVADSFSVVVGGDYGTGKFLFFGDDAIFQNRYLDQNNKQLAANLGRWLAGR